MIKKVIPILLLAVIVVGCNFVSTANKSIYVTSVTLDGAMKTYASYWKAETNQLGLTPQLENQRSNVMTMSIKAGAGLHVADRALKAYSGNLGTNTATKAIVNALLTTAVQEVGEVVTYVDLLQGTTNVFSNFGQ